jgi:hypothetical protein
MNWTGNRPVAISKARLKYREKFRHETQSIGSVGNTVDAPIVRGAPGTASHWGMDNNSFRHDAGRTPYQVGFDYQETIDGAACCNVRSPDREIHNMQSSV